jgi:hypothetical protein
MNCNKLDPLFTNTAHSHVEPDARQIRSHIASGCMECQRRLLRVKEILADMGDCALLPTPSWLMEQAMGLFNWKEAQPQDGSAPRVPALLLVDSAAQGQLAGFRSAGSMSRQLLYQAGDYNVNLSLSAAGPQLIDIMGQPMSMNADRQQPSEVDVALLKNSNIVCAAKSNEFGAFILSGIAEGIYNLRVKLVEEELEIIGLHAAVSTH